MKRDKLELDLLTNGFDFILESINSITKLNTDKNQIKYAILNLSAGTDLIFKERLARSHWSFIFEDINRADKSKLIAGDFISVNSNTCLKRLQNICLIEFSERDLRVIENLRKRRNKFEHFAIDENIESLKSIFSKVLSVLINFVDKEFKEISITEKQQEYYKNIRIKSGNFKKFVDFRINQIKEKLDAENWLTKCLHCEQRTAYYSESKNSLICHFCNQIDESKKIISCPKCLTKSLMLDGWSMKISCINCNYTDTPESVAELYGDTILNYCSHSAFIDGDRALITDCFECGNETLIVESDEYICLSCLEYWSSSSVNDCDTCGELYSFNSNSEDYSLICDSCISNRYSRD